MTPPKIQSERIHQGVYRGVAFNSSLQDDIGFGLDQVFKSIYEWPNFRDAYILNAPIKERALVNRL